MTHRPITFLFFTSMMAACSAKEDEDTSALAEEQSEPSGLNTADEGEPTEEEEEGQESENVDDDSEGDERERNEEPTDEEETESGDCAQGGTLSEGGESGDAGDGCVSSDGAVTVDATTLPTTLPPTGTSGTLTAYSTEAPGGLIRDLDVKIDLDHSCSKDLAATLTSPSGTTVVLFDLRELVVCSSDLEDTLLDDEASVLITRGATPFRGLHRPTGFLSDFDGEDAAGVWTLSILDDTIGDKGTLDFWSLNLRLD